MVKDREAWCAAVYEITESDMTERLNNSNSKILIKQHNSQAAPVSIRKSRGTACTTTVTQSCCGGGGHESWEHISASGITLWNKLFEIQLISSKTGEEVATTHSLSTRQPGGTREPWGQSGSRRWFDPWSGNWDPTCHGTSKPTSCIQRVPELKREIPCDTAKIPCAAAKTQRSQIRKYFLTLNCNKMLSRPL